MSKAIGMQALSQSVESDPNKGLLVTEVEALKRGEIVQDVMAYSTDRNHWNCQAPERTDCATVRRFYLKRDETVDHRVIRELC